VFARGAAVNVATLAGHGALRAAVLGLDDRAPTPQELASMKDLLHRAMQQGALGLSSGLCYVPGVYAHTSELVELARVASAHGGIYATHMRDQVDGLLASVEESVDVASRANARLLISHHKTCGPRNFGKARISLAMLDAARARGVETHSDMYPYLAGSTTLAMLFPPWVLDGGQKAMMARLASDACRARIRYDWAHGIAGWENRIAALGWESVTISCLKHAERQAWIGLTVDDAAKRAGQEVCDFVFDLMLAEQGEVGQIMQNSCEEDLRAVLTHPHSMVGSDGLDVGERPHPRQYGAFPKVLGELVRDKGWMTLEQAVHRMTGATARTFKLGGVGAAAGRLPCRCDGVRCRCGTRQRDLRRAAAIRQRHRVGVRQRAFHSCPGKGNGKPSRTRDSQKLTMRRRTLKTTGWTRSWPSLVTSLNRVCRTGSGCSGVRSARRRLRTTDFKV
jgi:dihydroorotase/N-acyl-D-amino-acid deacylase